MLIHLFNPLLLGHEWSSENFGHKRAPVGQHQRGKGLLHGSTILVTNSACKCPKAKLQLAVNQGVYVGLPTRVCRTRYRERRDLIDITH